jgi:hypothetical protein
MGTMLRTPLNIVYSSCAPRLSVPYASWALAPSLSLAARALVGRRAGSSGAVGVGRHYSIWKGLYGPYAALARNLSSGHRCRPSKDDDPMPLSLVLGI